MIARTFFRIPLLVALCLSATIFTNSQTLGEFDRPHNFDVQHYSIRVEFDRAKKQVFGDTTVVLKPTTENLRLVTLDAIALTFRSVTNSTTQLPLKYKTAVGKINISLDRTYGLGEEVSIRFTYTATPKKGVYFVDASNSSEANKHSAQIWTQGEPDEARHWFPSFDFPSDKATTEQFITADSEETVIGNGVLIDKANAQNGKVTWHYRMPVSHSTYLVSFVIGKYAKIEDKYNDIPLGFYVYPGRESLADKPFSATKKMMGVFEEATGVNYPFNKYDQTIVAKFAFGGMENVTATTLFDQDVFLIDLPFAKDIVGDLVSHELAHSWFGNLVTCKNWAELWLNEGFATYMEAIYREKAFGRENYLEKIRTDAAEFLVHDLVTRRRHGLYNRRANEVDKLFDVSAVTYNKGSVVLHMLRMQIGDEAFWKGVNAYLQTHKFGNVTSEDLKLSMETASGQDLDWFFDQWVYHSGAPKLNVSSVYTANPRTIIVKIDQTQRADLLVPAVFRLPLDITIETKAGAVTRSIEMKTRSTSITVELPGEPTSVSLYPDENVPLRSSTVSKIVRK